MATYLLPLYNSRIQAGFPSPADDYMEKKLDLNKCLIAHPAATFLVKAGNAVSNIGIEAGDILIVDRSVEPTHGKVVIAILNDRLVVRRFQKSGNDLEIWGVVTYVIHKL